MASWDGTDNQWNIGEPVNAVGRCTCASWAGAPVPAALAKKGGLAGLIAIGVSPAAGCNNLSRNQQPQVEYQENRDRPFSRVASSHRATNLTHVFRVPPQIGEPDQPST